MREQTKMLIIDASVYNCRQFFTAHQRSCVKIVFSVVPVCLSTGGWIQQNKIYKKLLTWPVIEPRSLAQLSGTLTITRQCFLCLCWAVIESYSCMGDSVGVSNSSNSSNWTIITSFWTRMHSIRMHTVHCSGHILGGGCLPRRDCMGVSAQGGVCLGGVCQTPPPVNRITDRCKNITLLQLRCGR